MNDDIKKYILLLIVVILFVIVFTSSIKTIKTKVREIKEEKTDKKLSNEMNKPENKIDYTTIAKQIVDSTSGYGTNEMLFFSAIEKMKTIKDFIGVDKLVTTMTGKDIDTIAREELSDNSILSNIPPEAKSKGITTEYQYYRHLKSKLK